ncbi:hypothetical protein LSUB1_G006535 [Lachnellula subtilissima]|uniref:Uncharacterized protein n=1 Tax=Lachnellula subtilissima TaxID=602034 RepID=A0A8H8RIG8_9HELO|nr:hypothetical protein LSUB1_G006535 [Lachnellula subtilissima]
MASKPTVAIVPGAYHTPVHFDAFISFLNAGGYPTVSKQLPSVDAATPTILPAREILTSLLTKSLRPSWMLAKTLSSLHTHMVVVQQAERIAAGKKGGIIGLIWATAFITPTNTSLRTLVGGKFKPWVEIDVFYNDVPDAIANVAIGEVKKMSLTALSTGTPAPGWANPRYQGRLAYFRTALDN